MDIAAPATPASTSLLNPSSHLVLLSSSNLSAPPYISLSHSAPTTFGRSAADVDQYELELPRT